MRVGILYYSMTGNSALAAERLAAGLPLDSQLLDMTASRRPDLSSFDAIAVVCPTSFWDVPPLVLRFIDGLSEQGGKPVVIVNTYGGISGRAMPRLARAVSAAGLRVVAGFSLHMPDSYPPLLAVGITAASAPSQSDAARFDTFIDRAGTALAAAVASGTSTPIQLTTTLLDKVFGQVGRLVPRRMNGSKTISAWSCTGCHTCLKGCPVQAIEAVSPPVFRPEACVGCWRCYNRCPQHAIRTRWFRGTPFYAGPSNDLIDRLGSRRTCDR